MSGPVGASENLGSDLLSDVELVDWFPDPCETAAVMLKWIEATMALEKIQDEPQLSRARGTWLAGCCEIRNTMKGNYSAVCSVLDGLTTQIRNLDPEALIKVPRKLPGRSPGAN